MNATGTHQRGTVLCDADGIPQAVVLGHTRHERDLTLGDPTGFVSEAAEWSAPDWDHDEDVIRRLASWIAGNSAPALWAYATVEDQEQYGAEDETWCGPGYRGAPIWVLAWDGDEAVAKAEEFGIAAAAEDDDVTTT
jgi:hypothetical protein